jgi:hypothetical protein
MNQGRSLKLVKIKEELSSFVERSSDDPFIISGLGWTMLERDWTQDELEEDLGTSAIEALLDEIENAGYAKLLETYEMLKSQELIK